MKILFSKYFPIKGYIAINIFGILIVRKDYKRRFQNIDDPWVVNLINHEAIHTGQIKECGYESYYPLYILFWIIRLITPPYKSSYRDISFEQEAQLWEYNFRYLNKRKRYSWVTRMFKSTLSAPENYQRYNSKVCDKLQNILLKTLK